MYWGPTDPFSIPTPWYHNFAQGAARCYGQCMLDPRLGPNIPFCPFHMGSRSNPFSYGFPGPMPPHFMPPGFMPDFRSYDMNGSSSNNAFAFFGPAGSTIRGLDYWEQWGTNAIRLKAFREFMAEMFNHLHPRLARAAAPRYFFQQFPHDTWWTNMSNPFGGFAARSMQYGPDVRAELFRAMFIREIDTDNWPFYLKCVMCTKAYKDPVLAIQSNGKPIACCRACVRPSGTQSQRRLAVPLRPPPGCNGVFPRADKLDYLLKKFERNFSTLIKTEASHLLCMLCKGVACGPTVTCKNVPPRFWIKSHGTNHVSGPVNHLFCAPCIEYHRYKKYGRHAFAPCPFEDNAWEVTTRFPVSKQHLQQQWRFAGRAWEMALKSAFGQ